jgi:hypothetical protein
MGLAVIAGVLSANAPAAFDQPAFTSLQAIARSPDAYANRAIRTIGRFRGRAAGHGGPAQIKPLRGRWDFLLNWDEEAVWVSGLRPVGRDFDLDPSSAADARSGPWLEVVGTVRVERLKRQHACVGTGTCRVWIDATDMRLAAPPWGIVLQTALTPVIGPPTVVFHDPVTDETDVAPSTAVRVQFSKHMAAETFSGRLRVSYSTPRPLFGPPVPGFHATYHDDTRGLDIRFTAPLAAFETVRVELLAGIRARDGRALPPWTLSFTTRRRDD